MMMELTYPVVVNSFYKPVLEFANFDLIETEELYGSLLDLEQDPYSDQVADIGYESRYLILNLGSIPIFIIINLVMQIFYSCCILVTKKGRVNRCA